LDKPDKLNEQEMAVMKTHTKLGAELLSSLQGELGDIARLICLFHHEYKNGGGYWKIPACFLPEYVSFVSVSDVFVSLISERSYKKAWTWGEALEYIKKQAGTQFCPELAGDFISLIQYDDRIPAIFEGI
jgi:HD-GYP domain-containing protein (c-di-GMP phosphodiesterase class II)